MLEKNIGGPMLGAGNYSSVFIVKYSVPDSIQNLCRFMSSPPSPTTIFRQINTLAVTPQAAQMRVSPLLELSPTPMLLYMHWAEGVLRQSVKQV